MSEPLSHWRERAKDLKFRERDDPVMGSWQEYLSFEMEADARDSEIATMRGIHEALDEASSEVVALQGKLDATQEMCEDVGKPIGYDTKYELAQNILAILKGEANE